MKLLAVLIVVVAGACATAVTLPSDRLASSEAAIKTAGALGATDVPQASLYLRMAEDEMTDAKSLADQGNAERAELYLNRARADADLAVAIVREARAKSAADRAQVEANALEGSTR